MTVTSYTDWFDPVTTINGTAGTVTPGSYGYFITATDYSPGSGLTPDFGLINVLADPWAAGTSTPIDLTWSWGPLIGGTHIFNGFSQATGDWIYAGGYDLANGYSGSAEWGASASMQAEAFRPAGATGDALWESEVDFELSGGSHIQVPEMQYLNAAVYFGPGISINDYPMPDGDAGVAVYFLSPRFRFEMSISEALDGSSAVTTNFDRHPFWTSPTGTGAIESGT